MRKRVVFVCYQTDVWHTHTSKVLFGIFNNFPNLVRGIKSVYKISDYQVGLLKDINQTQSSSDDEDGDYPGEFVIEEVEINTIQI